MMHFSFFFVATAIFDCCLGGSCVSVFFSQMRRISFSELRTILNVKGDSACKGLCAIYKEQGDKHGCVYVGYFVCVCVCMCDNER